MRIVKAGGLYFALVFGTGFVLGPIRILWVVPHFGTRLAELMEMPIMLGVVIITARWVVLHFALPSRLSSRLGMGCVALAMLLIGEFSLVLWLRGFSIREYFTTMDPISGTAFFVMQGLVAIMPLIVARR